MKLIQPTFKILRPESRDEGVASLRFIEYCARISHRSEEAQTADSWDRFIRANVIGCMHLTQPNDYKTLTSAQDGRKSLILSDLLEINVWHNGRPMSTAIVSAYTPEGFVIGADGRTRDIDTRSVISDVTQKIFFVERGHLKLMYAWAGELRFEGKDGQVLFDLRDLTDTVLKSSVMFCVSSFSDFACSFMSGLSQRLACTQGSPGIFGNREIARVLIVGYFYDQPCRVEIAVNRLPNTVFAPEIIGLSAPAPVKSSVFSGSKKAYKASNLALEIPLSLQEAVSSIRDYIRLCFTHRDPPLDCENSIGGHIHIGQLTPKGFSWVDPPILTP